MAFVEINPRYQAALGRQGLTRAEQFLDLPGVIFSGHPDRHVARVTLDPEGERFRGFLKREHRVRWRDRLVNWLDGFGPVSKSCREARMLAELGRLGVGGPELLAAGEDRRGRAFVLVRELVPAVDLRRFLNSPPATPALRHRLACRLGEFVARMHGHGYIHADLYAKHLLVTPDGCDLYLLDWQRARWIGTLDWRHRCRDLAALDATVADDLASAQERMTVLHAYLEVMRRDGVGIDDADIRALCRDIRRRRESLQRRRHVSEQLSPPLPPGDQNLIWVDGEALSVTSGFWRRMNGRTPDWLRPWHGRTWPHNMRVWSAVELPDGGDAHLVRRFTRDPFRMLLNRLRRRRPESPELAQAGLLFRLQRIGVAVPTLLAVGQRYSTGGRCESFILTEPVAGEIPFTEWLAGQSAQGLGGVERQQRRQLLGEAGRLLRKLHDLGCAGPGLHACQAALRQGFDGPALGLADLHGFVLRRKSADRATRLADLRQLRASLGPIRLGRADEVVFLRGYLGTPRLGSAGREVYRRLGRGRGGLVRSLWETIREAVCRALPPAANLQQPAVGPGATR